MSRPKNIFNTTNITDNDTVEAVELGALGYYCGINYEKIPEFDQADCETVYEGLNNSFIVLGRDRNASWASGCGGKGVEQCGMIDLVAGRGQLIMANNNKKKKEDPLEGVKFVGPMFHSDAARIYITQKCEDIDKYFGLKPTSGRSSKYKSAVALKADHVRMIGREKVKIFCGAGLYEGFDSTVGETNSLGQNLSGGRIELQVGRQSLQPLVLGDNLVDFLKKKSKREKKNYQMLNTISLNLMVLNGIVSALPGAGLALGPFMKENLTHTIESIIDTVNVYIEQLGGLDNDMLPGEDSILSRTVYTT